MDRYRIMEFDTDGRVCRARLLECDSDREAVRRVRQTLMSHARADVWHGARLVAHAIRTHFARDGTGDPGVGPLS